MVQVVWKKLGYRERTIGDGTRTTVSTGVGPEEDWESMRVRTKEDWGSTRAGFKESGEEGVWDEKTRVEREEKEEEKRARKRWVGMYKWDYWQQDRETHERTTIGGSD